MNIREALMKFRYRAPSLNAEGDSPVHFLKKALKLAGSENPSS